MAFFSVVAEMDGKITKGLVGKLEERRADVAASSVDGEIKDINSENHLSKTDVTARIYI